MLHYSVKSGAVFLRSVYSLVSWLDFDTERRIRALIQINSSARKEALESGLGRISRSRSFVSRREILLKRTSQYLVISRLFKYS